MIVHQRHPYHKYWILHRGSPADLGLGQRVTFSRPLDVARHLTRDVTSAPQVDLALPPATFAGTR